MTARQAIVKALQEHPDGLSRHELRKIVGCNPGTLRQQVASLTSTGDITVTKEQREYGETNVHRLVSNGA